MMKIAWDLDECSFILVALLGKKYLIHHSIHTQNYKIIGKQYVQKSRNQFSYNAAHCIDTEILSHVSLTVLHVCTLPDIILKS